MRYRALMLGIGAIFVVAGPVFASRAVADDLDECIHGGTDHRVVVCTLVIKAGGLGGHDLASVYLNRGIGYWIAGSLAPSLADIGEAIRLDPTFADAYKKRGEVYYNDGDIDHALADYDEAIRLFPKFAEAYSDRGYAYIHKGDSLRALADLRIAEGLLPPGKMKNEDEAEIKLLRQQANPVAPTAPAPTPSAVRRVALVIGNSAYRAGRFCQPPRRMPSWLARRCGARGSATSPSSMISTAKAWSPPSRLSRARPTPPIGR